MIRNNKSQPAVSNIFTSLSEFWIQYLIIFGLILFISLLFPSGQSLKYTYQLNDITREPIIAPFTFSILKTDKKYQPTEKMLELLAPLILQHGFLNHLSSIHMSRGDEQQIQNAAKSIVETFVSKNFK